MYSNDMWEHHPERPQDFREPLQYWDDGKITIERVAPKDQETLTARYTHRAVDFIRRRSSGPFFLYVPHTMPHVPLFCSERFRGRSKSGLYGDVMMEIDWSVGEIQRALRETGVERNTVFLFTSDNGPWTSYGNHAGKTPYREAKGTGFDGGTRSPCILRYPGRLKPGAVSSRAWCTIDVLPLFSQLAGASLPANDIDGRNVWDWISGVPSAENPNAYYAFSTNSTFEGVISGDGRWKLHLPHSYRVVSEVGNDGKAGKYRQERIELSLFDLQNDPLESVNVIGRYPEEAARMQAYAEEHRRAFYS
jgi:arylsulfatase A-like enzyme